MDSGTEKLKLAQKPAEDALRLHPFYRGKIEVSVKCSVKTLQDFAVWYSPGVAAPCKAISLNKNLVF